MKRPSLAGDVAFSALVAVTALGAFLLAACGASTGADQPVVEQEYEGGLPVDGAIEQETPNGGYRTVVGNPVVIVNGGVEPDNLLPYGGGEEGLRQAEDESPDYRPGL
jgi:hypothetical protein